jgi:N-acetylglutamate synthase-like GNAT family acetyltransferase
VTDLRRARAEDVDTLRELARSAYAHYVERIGAEPWPMREDYAARVAAEEVWVLEQDEAIAGFVVLQERADHLLLDNVAVRTDRQGTGVGSRLLAFAEEKARELGFSEIRLYTNESMTENLAYYPRRGYVETGRGSWHGYHRVHFAKRLGG